MGASAGIDKGRTCQHQMDRRKQRSAHFTKMGACLLLGSVEDLAEKVGVTTAVRRRARSSDDILLLISSPTLGSVSYNSSKQWK